MSNLIIQNEMDSTIDLSAINDVDGNPVSLWPRGDKRASREITEAASRHEAVQRVRDAKWVKLVPIAIARAQEDTGPPSNGVNQNPKASMEESIEDALRGLKRDVDRVIDHLDDSAPSEAETSVAPDVIIDVAPEQVATGIEKMVEAAQPTSPTSPADKATEPRAGRRARGA